MPAPRWRMVEIKQSAVDYLIASRKFIHRTIEDNSRHYPLPHEQRITLDIRRRDLPLEDIGLRLRALREPTSVIPHWGIALSWHGARIRCIDYKLREGVVSKSNGLELMRSIGLEV